MILNRRDALLAAATLAAAPGLLPRAASAQAPSAPAFHRLMVGSTAVTIVQDGVVNRPDVTQGLVPGVAPEAVLAALAAAGTPGRAQPNPYNQTVVQTRAGLVLIDTGLGQDGPAGTGRMTEAMRAAGLDPAAVTTVLITHFHGDHIGGLLAADGSAAFPNAVLKVPEAEYTFWHDAGEESRATEARRPGFANARRRLAPYAARTERFRPGTEVVPGITAIDTKGHSPGHVSFLVADGSAQCLVIGDAVVTPALFMANPDWPVSFDMDRTQALATRRALLDRAAAERMPVVGYHFPMPATGRVERSGSGYRLVAG